MPTDFTAGIEEARKLIERGLMHKALISGKEPSVVPRDLTVKLPDNFAMHGEHAYGTPESFIAYLRQVNHIPIEATEEIWTDSMRIDMQVRFKWWEVEVLTDQRWGVR